MLLVRVLTLEAENDNDSTYSPTAHGFRSAFDIRRAAFDDHATALYTVERNVVSESFKFLACVVFFLSFFAFFFWVLNSPPV